MRKAETISCLKEMRDKYVVSDPYYISIDAAIKTLERHLYEGEDSVDRAEMLEAYSELYDIFDDNKRIQTQLNKVYNKLRELPHVSPVESVGHWEEVVVNCLFGEKVTMCKCSKCKEVSLLSYKYCPECGSRNKGIRKISEVEREKNDK